MKCRTRRYFTESDKALIWDRWRKGDSLNAIARLFDTSHSAVAGVFSKTGGIRPPPKRSSQRALTLAERGNSGVRIVSDCYLAIRRRSPGT